jgi:hypothetical protein
MEPGRGADANIELCEGSGDAQSAVVHAMIDIADGAVALTDLLSRSSTHGHVVIRAGVVVDLCQLHDIVRPRRSAAACCAVDDAISTFPSIGTHVPLTMRSPAHGRAGWACRRASNVARRLSSIEWWPSCSTARSRVGAVAKDSAT